MSFRVFFCFKTEVAVQGGNSAQLLSGMYSYCYSAAVRGAGAVYTRAASSLSNMYSP